MSLIIETFPVTVFSQNSRILIDRETRNAVVVDPGGEAHRILRALKQREAVTQAMWLTHSHLDHCGGVTALEQLLRSEGQNISLLAHRAEASWRASLERQAMMFGLSAEEYPNVREPDILLEGGETVALGKYQFQALFTPGHSPGHIAFYCAEADLEEGGKRPIVIGGDALFAGSIGRTDLPGGNTEQLLTSIREKLLSLPDETLVLSGHGPDTTIGVERRQNPFLR